MKSEILTNVTFWIRCLILILDSFFVLHNNPFLTQFSLQVILQNYSILDLQKCLNYIKKKGQYLNVQLFIDFNKNQFSPAEKKSKPISQKALTLKLINCFISSYVFYCLLIPTNHVALSMTIIFSIHVTLEMKYSLVSK